MSKLIVPDGYKPALSPRETQTAIAFLKRSFQDDLCRVLNLTRVSAPLFVEEGTGLNDDLNGTERPVRFDLAETGADAVVVHSLAKWKRMALHKYGFVPFEGLCTDMNAIRRDEELDNLHSAYVDQWDWEMVIDREHRTEAYLRRVVQLIVDAICDTAEALEAQFPTLKCGLSRQIAFVTTQELEDRYPDLTPKQREDAFLKEHRTAFIMQIGGKLRSGERHDGRAPDYDDWSLNGDIVFYNELLGCAFEVSSMGIRVDAAALRAQLAEACCPQRAELPFHAALLAGELPLTLGGGIGQSRLSVLLLQKAHIGEVQVSVWDEATLAGCKAVGIPLL